MKKPWYSRSLVLLGVAVLAIIAGVAPIALVLASPNPRPAPNPAPLPAPGPSPSQPISVAVSPSDSGLTVTQSLTLTATVSNDSTNSGVTWSVSGTSCSGSACGTVTATNSTSAVYTAPSTAGIYSVTATSVADVTESSTATIGVTSLAGVYTYRNDYSRSSVNSQEYALNLSNVNSSSFGKLFSCAVDGAMYAQPLWVANETINGAKHNIVIVATENDSVYAFDADNGNGTACTLYWKASLFGTAYGAAAGATPIPASDTGETGDIQSEIGITSTPVINPTTNALYVVSNTKEGSNYYQRLHELNLSTGAEMTGAPVNITGSVSGTGAGSSGGTLAYSAIHENSRPGLALVNGSIYIAAGSHGDNEPWHGWVLQYNASTLAQTGVFCVSPNTSGGGIWMSGSAPVFDSSNNLYVISSNGTYDGKTEFGDTFLKLGTTSGLSLSDWFTPDDEATLATDNGDLGAGGAVTLMDSVTGPYPHLLIGGGKEGILYLVNRDNMGHYNSANNNAAVQTFQVAPDLGNYGGVSSSGEFWQNTFYIAGTNSPLEAFALNTTTDTFNTTPTSSSIATFGFPGVTPAISALGTANAIVWAIDTSMNGTNDASAGPAVVYAFDASNLANNLWNSSMGTNNQAGTAVKFAVPTVANGKVYVATTTELDVYGLLNQGSAADAPTFSPAPGSYTSAQTVTLSDGTSGATIYYTLDGSTPTTASSVYSTPISVTTTTTINAMAAVAGLTNSTVASGTFTIQGSGGSTIAYVQGASATPQSASTSVNVTFAGAQTAGDLNVVVVGWNDVTHTVASVTDTEKNAYTLAVGPTQNSAGTLTQAIYYAKSISTAAAGANTVTVTFSGAATYPDIRILEYSNADPNSPVDISAAATGSGTSSTVTASSATTNADDLLFAANTVTSTTTSAGAGFTSRMITVPDADIAEDRSVNAISTYTATANMSSGQWVMQMVAFKVSSGTGGDTTPPTTPSNLAASAVSDNQINLSWTASTDNVGVTGYLIQRCQGAGCTSFTQVATSTTNSYTDSGDLLGNTSFSYRVEATDAAGNLSGFSNVASATTLADTTPPTTPTNLVATATSSTEIDLTWTASTDDVGVTSYYVQRCQGVGCTAFVQVASTRTPGLDDTGLQAGTTYSYRVQATDYAGNLSGFSTVATATTPSTSGPSVLSVSPNSGPIAGGTAVTITGTGFASGATVTFGSAAATNVTVSSSTTIAATTPANAAGAATVTVTDPGNLSGSLQNGFTYNAPTTITYVQGAYATPQSSQTAVSVTYAQAQNAGDLNVVVVGWNDSTASVTSVTDSHGTPYVLAVGPTQISGTLSQSIYYLKNIPAAAAGANTVKVTFSTAAAYPDIRILEYYGADPNNPVDVTAAATGSGGTTSSGSATTTNANDLIFGANIVTGETSGPGSGFTQRLLTVPDADIAEDKMVTATGSYSATAPASGQWIMQMVAIRTSSAGGSDTTPPTAPSALMGPNPQVIAEQGYDNPTFLTTHTTAAFDSTGGDVLVLFASSHAGVTMTPSDTYNNTWISIAGPTSTTTGFDLRSQMWYVKNPVVGPGETVSVTLSTAESFVMSVFVVKGSNVPAPLDAFSPIGDDAGTQSLNVASPNIQAAIADDLLLGWAKSSVSETFTSGTGFTPQPNASGDFLDAESEPVATPGSYDATFTLSTAATWQSSVVAVEPPVTASSSTQINLSWTASTDNVGVTGYFVERCQGSSCSNFTQIGTTTGTTFTDTGLSPSTAYSYRVRATDAAGNLSSYSNIAVASTQAPQAPPTVTSISPNSGSTAGGTAVTINGTNFASGATVTIGGAPANNVVVVSSTQITATTPAGTAGAATVTVTNVGSQSGSLTNGFTYIVAPSVTGISPNSGATAGGTSVTITGTNFASGATVTIGSAAATNVVVVSSTQITATTPAGTAGPATVKVTANGQSGSLTNGFTYIAPATVSSISPNTGSTAGGTAITITGTNFATGATVTIGANAATNVVVVSSTQITASTPAGTTGSATVTVTNPGVAGGSLTNGFTYVVTPTISSISPNSGPSTGGTAVTITGSNFASGATVTIGSTAATNVVVVSATQISATTPSGAAGAATVAVTLNGQTGTLLNGFTYTSVVPISYSQVAASTPQTPTATVTLAYPAAETAGDLNIVVVGWNDTTATVQTVTDSAGNSYKLAIGPTSGTALRQSIYYASNIAGAADTVTVQFSQAAVYPDVRILEYRGVSTLDVTAGASGSGTAASSGSATTTSANELIFAADTISTTTTAAGSGFTSRIITSPDSDLVEDKTVTATGSYSATASLSSGSWVIQMATFK